VKNTAKNKFIFFEKKNKQFTRQATGETFSPQKRTSSISKKETDQLFLFLWVIFGLLDPDPGTPLNPDPIRIRNTTVGC
jgi:hypothetical protein